MKQLIDLNGKWRLYIAPHNQVKESSLCGSECLKEDCLPDGIDFIKIDAEVPGKL